VIAAASTLRVRHTSNMAATTRTTKTTEEPPNSLTNDELVPKSTHDAPATASPDKLDDASNPGAAKPARLRTTATPAAPTAALRFP